LYCNTTHIKAAQLNSLKLSGEGKLAAAVHQAADAIYTQAHTQQCGETKAHTKAAHLNSLKLSRDRPNQLWLSIRPITQSSKHTRQVSEHA
jgi:hypothetical protein